MIHVMKKLPIGISDFKEIIKNDYYYIDKTLFIKELVDSSGLVLLIPRPRRFGKTLNLSMLKYFFEKTETNHSELFTATNIWHHDEYRKLQGTFPVISLTFKDIKESSWEIAYKKTITVIAQEFEHHFLALKGQLSEFQLGKYTSIMEERADQADYHNSLFFLTTLLHDVYNEQVIVLIDEYDAPIHAGYNNGFYKEIIEFMRSFLTSVLKDNNRLKRGILTGILRTTKEGIFSGLNNLKVCSLLDDSFQDKFGFTQSEVERYLNDFGYLNNLENVQQWYNGYTIGETTIYNPWSLLMYADHKGKLQPYWVNTSDNQIIKKLLTVSGSDVKIEMESLLSDVTITTAVDEAVIFPGIENNAQALWSLLLFSGYLTYSSCELKEGITYCNLRIPNKEVKTVYQSLIREIFQATLTLQTTKRFFQALTEGDVETFSHLLQEFVMTTMSFYDLPEKEAERSYHLFVLGLLVLLTDTHHVRSNRESGYGRYDIMLIPHDKNKLGIIIELKKVLSYNKETLETAAQQALEQINTKHYNLELKALGIKQIKALGIAFQGKQILVLEADLD